MIAKVVRAIRRTWRSLSAAVRIQLDPVAYARSIGVKVGRDVSLISIHGGTFGAEPYLVTLGDHVRVTARVQFITHDGGAWVLRAQDPDLNIMGPIVVGNNVFIGFGAIILPNVRIGDNVVIGAGSVVTKDIPADSVAAGVPARIIQTREEYRQRALQKRFPGTWRTQEEKRRVILARFGR